MSTNSSNPIHSSQDLHEFPKTSSTLINLAILLKNQQLLSLIYTLELFIISPSLFQINQYVKAVIFFS